VRGGRGGRRSTRSSRRERRGCSSGYTLSRASPSCECVTWSPTTGRAYVPGDESRPTERAGEHNPLAYATPSVGCGIAHENPLRTAPDRPPPPPPPPLPAPLTDPRVLYVQRGGDRRGATRCKGRGEGRGGEERGGGIGLPSRLQ